MSGQPSETSVQLPLDLPITPRLGRDDFLAAPANLSALTMIEEWPNWPNRMISINGPPGSGKSHLLAIWAAQSQAQIYTGAALPSLEELVRRNLSAIGIDDVDQLKDETALFHLLNFATEHQVFVVMTARRLLRRDEVTLPDLLSRLRLALSLEINAPDEALVRAVLEKLFKDRQLIVDAPALDYAALRLDRSLEAVRAFVAAIDRAALAQGRPITRALAAEIMANWLPNTDWGED
jgi:chromosomal replication initiation ATPase DnaA